jgi:glutamyl-tRNA reductase
MPTLHVYGIDHSRASLEIREELAFSETELNELLPMFLTSDASAAASGTVCEVMLLSTCNRTEVYLVTEGVPAAYPLEPLRQYRPQARVMDDLCLRYHWQGDVVTKHLFAVAASLRSEVPGDTQIGTQVAAAARIARMAGTLGPLLEHLVAGALRTAKRVRRETGLAVGSSGTGPAVLRSLRRLVPASGRAAKPIRVILLGAGVMAEDVSNHLSRSGLHSGNRGCSGSNAVPAVAIAGVWAGTPRRQPDLPLGLACPRSRWTRPLVRSPLSTR